MGPRGNPVASKLTKEAEPNGEEAAAVKATANQTITPVGMELNPSTEHIDEPYPENVEKMLKRKGVVIKKKSGEDDKEKLNQ